MAEGQKYDEKELIEGFKYFCDGKLVMTSTYCGKLVKSCWGKDKSNAADIAFSSTFKGQKNVPLNIDNIRKYIAVMAKETKKTEAFLAEKVITGLEKAKETKKETAKTMTSKVGGVDRLTDTTKYTGSHKERFDESGKGKGAAGRQDKVENTGYVGNYKNAGTYDKKK